MRSRSTAAPSTRAPTFRAALSRRSQPAGPTEDRRRRGAAERPTVRSALDLALVRGARHHGEDRRRRGRRLRARRSDRVQARRRARRARRRLPAGARAALRAGAAPARARLRVRPRRDLLRAVAAARAHRDRRRTWWRRRAEAARRAKELTAAGVLPPPLVDSPRVRRLLARRHLPPRRDEPPPRRRARQPQTRPRSRASPMAEFWPTDPTAGRRRRRRSCFADCSPRATTSSRSTCRSKERKVSLVGEELVVRGQEGRGARAPRRTCRTSPCSATCRSPRKRSARTLERGLSVSFLSTGGWFYGRATGVESKNVELRVAQHRAMADPEVCLRLARGIVASKIRNCRTLLRRNHDAPLRGDALRARAARQEGRASRVDSLRCSESRGRPLEATSRRSRGCSRGRGRRPSTSTGETVGRRETPSTRCFRSHTRCSPKTSLTSRRTRASTRSSVSTISRASAAPPSRST